MNLYAVSPKQSKRQERTLLPPILNTYNCHSPSQRIAVKQDVTFPSPVPGVSQVSARTCRTGILQRTPHPTWRSALGHRFPPAEATGVSICIEEMPKHPTGTKGTAGTARKFPPHTGAYNKVGNDNISEEREGEEELLPGSEPQHQLPTFPKNNWPEFLQRIIKAGSSPIQHDIMLLGALTALGACMSRHVRCYMAANTITPASNVS